MGHLYHTTVFNSLNLVPVLEILLFFSQPLAGLTNQVPVRDSRAGAPCLPGLSFRDVTGPLTNNYIIRSAHGPLL
jgi:hypothetical protein